MNQMFTGWLNDHATDLLCMPIVLSILLLVTQVLKKDKNLTLPWYAVALTVVYWSIYFEWYLPKQSGIYTSDQMDVYMYIIGGIAYFFWQKSVFKRQMPLRPEHLPLDKASN